MEQRKSINQNYTLEAEILTPVHVGAGAEKDWLQNADFVFDKGKVYLLDHKKVIDKIGPDKFAHALTDPNNSSLKNMLPGPVADYDSKVLECDAQTHNEIRAQVRAGLENKPVIPGSSLKGALRSIIIHHLDPSNKTRNNNQLNKQIMGSPTDGDEFGRFFKVTDVSFEETKLTNSKIFNLTQKGNNFESGWKHANKNNTKPNFDPTGFNTVYEVIASKQKGMFDLMLAELPWKNLQSEQFYPKLKKDAARKQNQQKLYDIASLEKRVEAKTQIVKGSIEDLFGIINDYTRNYLEKEIAFFEKYNQAKNSNKMLESLTALKSLIPTDNSYCIMRLAAGSGFHSITGDWKLESHEINGLKKNGKKMQGSLNNELSAKSRKIAISHGQFMPMGFIKLRQVTEAEIKAREEQQRQKREEARKQKEMEAKRRDEERIRNEKIKKLLEKADELLAKEQFTAALEKLDEVAEMNPGDTRPDEKREAIENARKAYEERLREEERRKAFEEEQRRKAEDLKKRQEANKAKKEKEEKQLLEQGLAKLAEIQDYDQGRQFIETYFRLNQNKIPESEKNHLKDFARRMKQQKPKDLKKVNKGNWKLISKWIGKDEAHQWFEEFK